MMLAAAAVAASQTGLTLKHETFQLLTLICRTIVTTSDDANPTLQEREARMPARTGCPPSGKGSTRVAFEPVPRSPLALLAPTCSCCMVGLRELWGSSWARVPKEVGTKWLLATCSLMQGTPHSVDRVLRGDARVEDAGELLRRAGAHDANVLLQCSADALVP